MTTAAPSAASPLAIPAPMPFDAPVTTAVLPDNLRAQWAKYQGRIEPERLVFIDETWSKTNMAPLTG
jgi:hypothetical protein